MAKADVKKKKPAMVKGFPPEKAAELYLRLAKERPDPKTELEYKDPYTLVVAVALSAQATDVSVNKATKSLFKAANTPAKMVKLGEAGVADHIRTIGLWRNKAKNVVALSQMILDKHGGETPRTREDHLRQRDNVLRLVAPQADRPDVLGHARFAQLHHLGWRVGRLEQSPGRLVDRNIRRLR